MWLENTRPTLASLRFSFSSFSGSWLPLSPLLVSMFCSSGLPHCSASCWFRFSSPAARLDFFKSAVFREIIYISNLQKRCVWWRHFMSAVLNIECSLWNNDKHSFFWDVKDRPTSTGVFGCSVQGACQQSINMADGEFMQHFVEMCREAKTVHTRPKRLTSWVHLDHWAIA